MTSGFLLRGLFTSLANFLLVMKTKGVSPVICSGLHKQICAGSGYWTVSELEAMKHFSKNCMSISTFRLLMSFPEKFWIAMRRSAKGWFVSPSLCWCLGHRFFKNLLRNEVLPFPFGNKKCPGALKKDHACTLLVEKGCQLVHKDWEGFCELLEFSFIGSEW